MPYKDPDKRKEYLRQYYVKHRQLRPRTAQSIEEKKIRTTEYNKQYYIKNKTKELERGRKYCEENRESVLAQKQRHHAANKEREIPQKRAWYNANRQKQINYARQYAKDHPEWAKAQNRKSYITLKQWRKDHPDELRIMARQWFHNRRARIAANGGSFTREDVDSLLKKQTGRCYWCKGAHGKSFHVDHIWPLAKGGSNGPENICIACPSCNRSKNDKTPMEFGGRLL